MLIAIRDYLSVRGTCSLADLSRHFRTNADAMRGMLLHWLRKGQLIRETAGCQQGCASCSADQLELYRWQGGGGRQIALRRLNTGS